MEDSVGKLRGVNFDPEWVTTEPVMAVWEDNAAGHDRYLGSLSGRQSGVNFTMRIGFDPANNGKLLIAFHLPIKFRPSSSTKPKDIYLVLPAEFSQLSVEVTPVKSLSDSELTKAGLVQSAINGPQNVLRGQWKMKQLGYTVMPQGKLKADVRGTPLQLLKDLQALSSVNTFEIILNFSTHAQVQLIRIAEKMSSCTLATPELDLRSMYGRPGTLNAWDQFGIEPVDQAKSGLNPLVPEREGVSLPAYDHLESRPPEILVPYSGSEKESPMPQGLFDEQCIAPETPPENNRKRKRGWNTEESAAATSTAPAHLGGPERTHENETRQPIPIPSTAPQAHDHLHLSQRTDTTETDLFARMVQWLLAAWEILPTAHTCLRADLLALGAAARSSDSTRFAVLRSQATTRLVMFVAKENVAASHSSQEPPAPCSPAPCDFSADTEHVVSWINGVYDAADIVLQRDLVVLAEAALDDAATASNAFMKQKAICIVRASLLFG
ncbi:uncharacterized protein K452DRAFT_138061 [Aplosporella prunicola CBS 121167]|uniref:Uncharacterized protein n=1 Tax=Aplosporella prunicola CBS 121167 TaxID=1176127 RepID=A0A6A6AYW6_9PEZI|nr:uncharacterized protein K452DRAFT_138061 [Aplosporella prunicola CBS 121167]KAF2136383.1 hypothetical protein K452DRAFT_138061 [Aplosporella prunicola CBS 121167]